MNILTEEQHLALARRSWIAEKEHNEIEMITNTWPDLTRPEGYQIQNVRTQLVISEGHIVVGYKLGSTGMRKRLQMGSTESSYGRLFEYMNIEQGEPLDLTNFIHPKVEPEVTFFLKKDLTGPFVTTAEVLDATDYVAASLEIIDSRYLDFKFKGPDVVADNISGGAFTISKRKVSPMDLELELLGVDICLNGHSVGQAVSGEIMGHPARAISDFLKVFYKNTGEGIKAGQFIMTGGITQSFTLHAGDEVRADFAELGPVTLTVR